MVPKRFAALMARPDVRFVTLIGLTVIGAMWFATPRTRPLLLNTLCYAGGAALLSLPLGLWMSCELYRSDFPGRRILRWLLVAILVVPPYLHLTAWEAGFGLQGWFCRWMFPNEPVAILAGWRGAMGMQILVNVPWIVLLLGAAMETIPPELEQQAALAGSPRLVFRRVTLPLILPTLAAAGLWVFVLAAGDITITDMYQIRTFAEEVYTGFALGDQIHEASLRSRSGLWLIGGAVLAALVAASNVVKNLEAIRSPGPPRSLPRASWYRAALIYLFFAGWVCVPIGSLGFQAGLDVQAFGDERVRTWSAPKCFQMIVAGPAKFREELAWSFALGQLCAVTVVAVALACSWSTRRNRMGRMVVWCTAAAGVAVPAPILALTMATLVNQPNSPWLIYLYDRTLFLPWLVLSLRLFPFGVILAEVLVRRISTRPWQIVELSGPNPWMRFRHGIWPQLASPLGMLWLLILALALGDLSATILAVPPGMTTAAIRIFNLAHYGVGDQLAGLCLTTVMIFSLLAVALRSLLTD